MNNCLFCKIIQKEIPAKIAYEDEDIMAFHDISPQAPLHLVFIPKKHIQSLSHLELQDANIIGKIHLQIAEVARSLQIDQTGYRVVNNTGENGGQTVFHIHFHLLANRQMQWPPG